MVVVIQQGNRRIVLPTIPSSILERRYFMSITCPEPKKGDPLANLRHRGIEGKGSMRGNAVSSVFQVIFDFDCEPCLTAAVGADKQERRSRLDLKINGAGRGRH